MYHRNSSSFLRNPSVSSRTVASTATAQAGRVPVKHAAAPAKRQVPNTSTSIQGKRKRLPPRKTSWELPPPSFRHTHQLTFSSVFHRLWHFPACSRFLSTSLLHLERRLLFYSQHTHSLLFLLRFPFPPLPPCVPHRNSSPQLTSSRAVFLYPDIVAFWLSFLTSAKGQEERSGSAENFLLFLAFWWLLAKVDSAILPYPIVIFQQQPGPFVLQSFTGRVHFSARLCLGPEVSHSLHFDYIPFQNQRQGRLYTTFRHSREE
ncbi:hypothetical protein V8C26DRAFT_398751 [Trichoderma gracile]